MWQLRNGAKWPFYNESAFNSQVSSSELAGVTDSVLAGYPTAGAGYRDGTLFKTPDGKTFVASDGNKRWITSEQVFNGLGLSWANVRSLSVFEANVHPPGPDVSSSSAVPNGVFVKTAASPQVYLVVGGRARGIPTESVFSSYRASISRRWPP